VIEADHTTTINTPITTVWDYVQHIEKWATLFPGCRECEVINDDDSRWIIKVGAGGLVKTVTVLVHIDKWAGPEAVDFSFKLQTEPVTGNGKFRAKQLGSAETEISMGVQVIGTGAMAPMWEAVSKPLLPQLAKAFASSLKAEIEQIPTPARPSLLGALAAWLRGVFQRLFGSR